MATDDLQMPAYDRAGLVCSLYTGTPRSGNMALPAYDRAGKLVALRIEEAAEDDLVVRLVDRENAVVAATGEWRPWFVVQGGAGAKDGTSWANAFEFVQDGLDAAGVSGDLHEVWVKAGTYTPKGADTYVGWFNKVGSFEDRHIRLYGGFDGTETSRDQRNWEANVTTLDGLGTTQVVLMRDDDSIYPMFNTLDGFFIQNDDAGYGVYAYGFQSSLEVHLNHCFAQDCTTAIYVFYVVEASVISRCWTQDNDNGIVVQVTSSMTIEKCVSMSNADRGFFVGVGAPVLVNCLAILNGGHGIDMGVFGGDIINCTSADNTGRGLNGLEIYADIWNCIFWGNGAAITAGLDVTYSDVQGGYAGVGNINADPLLAGLMYDITNASPCKNTGTVTGAPSDDILDRPRPFPGTVVDMGSAEYQGA